MWIGVLGKKTTDLKDHHLSQQWPDNIFKRQDYKREEDGIHILERKTQVDPISTPSSKYESNNEVTDLSSLNDLR